MNPADRRGPPGLIVVVAAVMTALYGVLYVPFRPSIEIFVAVAIVTSLLYLIVAHLLLRARGQFSDRVALPLIALGIVARIALVPAPPAGSDDIYRYVWDGKVQAAGIDPYRYAPADSALRSLHDTLLPARVTYPAMKTVYPPLAQWTFAGLYRLGGEQLPVFKGGMVAADILTLFMLVALLGELGRPKAWAALYALCPLPILQFAVDGHCDALMFPFLIAALIVWRRGLRMLASGAIGLAALAKLTPLILLPGLFRAERLRRAAYGCGIAGAVVLAGYLPSVLSGGTPLEPLRTYSLHWAANNLLFELIYLLVGNNQTAHALSALLFLVWLAMVLRRSRPVEEYLFLTLMGFFLTSATVHPWYLTAVAVLLPLTPQWSGIALAALSSLATIPLIRYVELHRWEQPLPLLFLEYLPVYILLWQESRARASAQKSV